MREALLWTLEQTLREIFTAEVRAAWIAVYEMMAQAMKEAAVKEASSVEA